MSVAAHTEGCSCTRCAGFQPGHTLSTRHGAYATLRLGARASEIAERLRTVVPAGAEADEPTVALLAVTLARVEAAERALAGLDERIEENPLSVYLSDSREKLERLRADLRGWVHTAARLAEALGMTPRSRAQLGLAVQQLQQTFERDRLSASEQSELRRLLVKAGATLPEGDDG